MRTKEFYISLRKWSLTLCLTIVCVLGHLFCHAKEQTGIVETGRAITHDTTDIVNTIKKGISWNNKNRDSAITILQQGLQLSREVEFSYGIALSTFYLSLHYQKIGLYHESLDLLNECIIHSIRSRRKAFSLPYLYGNVASIYIYLGNYRAATLYLYQAIAFLGIQSEPAPAINLFNNLGATLLNLPDLFQDGFLEKALFYLELAQRHAEQGHHTELLIAAWVNKADYYNKLGEWDIANAYLDTALSLTQNVNLPEVRACALTTKAEVFLSRGLPDSALSFFNQAYIIRDINPYYVLLIETGLGQTYFQTGEIKRAESLLLNALTKAQKSGLNYNMLQIHRLLSEIYQQNKNFEKSLNHYQAYTALKDQIAGNDAVNNISLLEVKYNIAEKDRELALRQLLISEQAQKIQKNKLIVGGIASLAIVLSLIFLGMHRNNIQKQKIQSNQIRILEQEQHLLTHKQEIVQLKAMIKGEEKERARIAQELHDGIGGMLAAAKMNLNSLRKKVDPDAEEPLRLIANILSDTSDEVRKTAQNLMPHILLKHNLPKALEHFCYTISNTSETKIDLHVHNYEPLPDKSLELIIYRMIQELVQNIMKHAAATQAEIQIMMYEGKLNITVEDNGRGFDLNKEYSGIGLQNLRNRANTLKGYLSITSSPGRSTTVHMEFDIEKLNLALNPDEH